MARIKKYILICILTATISLVSICNAQSASAEDSKDLTDKEKQKNDESKKDETDTGESEDHIYNPGRSFKLIAIYLIGNKARALIKNLNLPDEPPKEFKVGDYIDEDEIFSISRISLNPTSRIELIDANGLSYILKPKSRENDQNTQSMSVTTSKPTPTYYSGAKKKKLTLPKTEETSTQPTPPPSTSDSSAQPTPPPSTSDSSAQPTPPPTNTPPPTPLTQASTSSSSGGETANTNSGSLESTLQNDANAPQQPSSQQNPSDTSAQSPPATPPPSPTTNQNTASPPPLQKPGSNMPPLLPGEPPRPSNPFGEGY